MHVDAYVCTCMHASIYKDLRVYSGTCALNVIGYAEAYMCMYFYTLERYAGRYMCMHAFAGHAHTCTHRPCPYMHIQVRGTRDPRKARIVLHGWFTDLGEHIMCLVCFR